MTTNPEGDLVEFAVTVFVSISGEVRVKLPKGSTKEEAIGRARELWSNLGQDSLSCPCIDVDWPDDSGDMEELVTVDGEGNDD